MNEQPTPREMGYYFALAGVGLEMVLPAALGLYLDDWLGSGPWITMTLGAAGFAGGLIHLMAIVNRQARDESQDRKPPP
jgi:F0F1-type ATP synthase assembly protein I